MNACIDFDSFKNDFDALESPKYLVEILFQILSTSSGRTLKETPSKLPPSALKFANRACFISAFLRNAIEQ